MKTSILLLLFLACHLPAVAQPPNANRIVFLGDSITQDARYIEMLEAAWLVADPTKDRIIIPLGLSSETVSGLTEPGHAGGQFPRPDLHERLERVLAKAKPDLVIACYGMNDGIYHPLDAARTKAFQDGILKLRQKVEAAGAKIIHITPSVFDSLPIRHVTLPAGLEKYEKPYVDYNTVLDAYSDWLLKMAKEKQWQVMDLHGPMNTALAEKRKSNPKFTFAPDGVHPSQEGQVFIAKTIAQAWGWKLNEDGSPVHARGIEILKVIKKKRAILGQAWLSHVGHKRPGVPDGLPLTEAEKQAATLLAEALKLVRE